jgi:hypothetical protein
MTPMETRSVRALSVNTNIKQLDNKMYEQYKANKTIVANVEGLQDVSSLTVIIYKITVKDVNGAEVSSKQEMYFVFEANKGISMPIKDDVSGKFYYTLDIYFNSFEYEYDDTITITIVADDDGKGGTDNGNSNGNSNGSDNGLISIGGEDSVGDGDSNILLISLSLGGVLVAIILAVILIKSKSKSSKTAYNAARSSKSARNTRSRYRR